MNPERDSRAKPRICNHVLRCAFALLLGAIAAAATSPAQADPYRWCAVYGGGGDNGGGSNCYFVTLEQCRATISGAGGFCEPNQFYDGRPVTTPGEIASRRKKPALR